MAHYRKIDIRIWLDQKFNGLSSDSQFVFLYLLTHPQLTALGAMRSTVPGLAAELDWSLDRFEAAFAALCQATLVAIDKKACFVWAINFLKYNPPESPNVVRSWGTSLDYLPECDLKSQLIQKTRLFLATLPPTFQEALPACFEFTTSLINSNEVTPNTFLQGKVSSAVDLPITLSKALPKAVNVTQESLEVNTERVVESHAALNSNFTSILPKVLSEKAPKLQGSLPEELAEGFPEGFGEGLAKTFLNHRTLNIEHRTLSNKHKTLSIKQEQKEKVVLQEKNLEEKEEIEEIKHIVTLARPKNSKSSDSEIVDVFSCWKQTLRHPQAVLDAKRRKRIRQAMVSGYSVSQLCEAIRGCSCTPHNMGDNEQGQRYDSIHVIFRDADQIDRFIRNAHSPPRPQSTADKTLAIGKSWLQKKMREQTQVEKTVHECT